MAAGADHGRTNNRGAVFDLGHAAHVDGAADVDLVPVGGHVQAGIDPGLNFLAGDAHLTHIPQQDATDGLPVIGHLADVHPFEIHRNGIERGAESSQSGEQIGADVKGDTGRDVLENFWFEDVDASVDRVAQGLFDLGFLLEMGDSILIIGDHDAVAAHLLLGNALGDEAGEGTLLPVTAHRFGEVEVDQGVSAEDHKGVVKKVLEVLDFLQATGGTQGAADQFAVFDPPLKAVGDFHTEALPIAEIILDLLCQVGDVHHHLIEAMLLEQLEQKLHHGFLQDGDHRFRDHMGDRLNPCSLSGRQDHRLHRRF